MTHEKPPSDATEETKAAAETDSYSSLFRWISVIATVCIAILVIWIAMR